MEQWNNVELSDMSKKSYTLNHEYDKAKENNNLNGAANESNGNAHASANGKESSQVLQPGSDIKPKVKEEDVEALLRRLYGITISEMREMISYDDRNYLIKEDRNIKNPLIPKPCADGYVLKILNALDSKKTDFVDAQNQLMQYLFKQKIKCPTPIANVNGKTFSVEQLNGSEHVVRLLEFVPGQIFHQAELSNFLLFQSGEYLAKIDRALKNFSHEAYETHESLWMLQSVPKLRDFVYALKDESKKALVEDIIATFESKVLSQLDSFEKQIIHGDYNEQNIIVNRAAEQKEYRVTGIIDFGDTNKSPLLFELGIAMTYMMLQAKSLQSGGIFLAGYNSILPISQEEKALLKYCIAARLAQSLVMGSYTHSLDPSNEYVLVTQAEGWKLITSLWSENLKSIDELWQTSADQYLTQSNK